MTKLRLKTHTKVKLYQIAILGIVVKMLFLPAIFTKAAGENVNNEKIQSLVENILKPQPAEQVNIDIEVALSQSEKKQIAEYNRLAELQKQQNQAVQAKKLAIVRTQASQPYAQASSGNAEVDNLIDQYASAYGVTEKAGKIKKMVWCESKGDPNAKNRYSTAGGLAQYLDSSWAGTPQGQAGLSKYDPQAATEAIVVDVSQGLERKWNASRSCWTRS